MAATPEKPDDPLTRLIAAARKAQDVLQADHCNLTTHAWDDDDAMQTFEDIECAIADIEHEKGVQS